MHKLELAFYPLVAIYPLLEQLWSDVLWYIQVTEWCEFINDTYLNCVKEGSNT